MTETAKERRMRETLELIADESMWHTEWPMRKSTIKTMVENAASALDDVSVMADTKDISYEDFKITLNYLNKVVAITETERDQLKKENDIMKYFLKNILDVDPHYHGRATISHLSNCVHVMKISAEKALAEIGGEDE